MKSLYIILTVSICILSSCGNRKIGLENESPIPVLSVTDKSGNPISTDSLKLTLKSLKKTSNLILNIGGNKIDKQLGITTVNASGTLAVDGQSGNNMTLGNGNHSIIYNPTTINGTTLIVFQITDNFGKMSSRQVEVVTFDNLSPKASLTTKLTGLYSAREYQLDASGSYDRDSKFGGFITSYAYKINDKVINSTNSKIEWIFGESGNYNISVTVTDNDGGSDTFPLANPLIVQ